MFHYASSDFLFLKFSNKELDETNHWTAVKPHFKQENRERKAWNSALAVFQKTSGVKSERIRY
jgi:hypothetical protein